MADSATDLEIERKFLVRGAWPPAQLVQNIRQIYLNPGAAVSVRLRATDDDYSLTIKRNRTTVVRTEFNIPVAQDVGERMMATLGGAAQIEKTRHSVMDCGNLWVVDVFSGANAGLMLAEIELQDEHQLFEKPGWIGPEVTHDPRFSNHTLFRNPFSRWGLTYGDLLTTL